MTLKSIKQNFKTFFSAGAVFSSLFFPMLVKAQAVSDGLRSSGFSSIFGNGPLQQQTSITGLIVQIIKIMLFFSGIIAVVFVIIGGYFYITSQGNEEQAEKGQKTMTNALIGVVVTILSYVIVNVISNLVLQGARPA
jgi:heme/copper-type cytochrome/quinol oxidase subunit 2